MRQKLLIDCQDIKKAIVMWLKTLGHEVDVQDVKVRIHLPGRGRL